MSRVTTSIRRLSPVLLALIALRALVPTGYMPASAGSGFLFEMCHDAPELATPETPTQAYRLSLAPRYRQAPRGPPLA